MNHYEQFLRTANKGVWDFPVHLIHQYLAYIAEGLRKLVRGQLALLPKLFLDELGRRGSYLSSRLAHF